MKKNIFKSNSKLSPANLIPFLFLAFAPSMAFAANTAYGRWLCGLWAYISDIILPLSAIMLMAAGFLWTTAGGNPKGIDKAKEIIWGVVSGLGFLLLSYILIKYVIGIENVSIIPGHDCMWGK